MSAARGKPRPWPERKGTKGAAVAKSASVGKPAKRGASAKPRTAAKRATVANAADEAAALRAYFAGLSPQTRRVAKALRALIRSAAPDAADAYSYRIAALRLDGRMLLWYAGWAEHVSMYPVTPAMQQEAGEQLAPYRASKGTLRFPLNAPLPAELIVRLVRARVREMRR
jgi:uncharacterized protein YdhG (YjbR/CyaY superfamily)